MRQKRNPFNERKYSMEKKLNQQIAELNLAVEKSLANELDFYQIQETLKKAFVDCLITLKSDYSADNSKALFSALKPLQDFRVRRLLESRVYDKSTYSTLSQLVTIKFDKGIIDFSKQATVAGLEAFKHGENGLTAPEPQKGFAKASNKAEAQAVALEFGQTLVIPGKAAPKPAKETKLQKRCTNVSKAMRLIKNFLEDNRLADIQARLTEGFEVLSKKVDSIYISEDQLTEGRPSDDVAVLPESAEPTSGETKAA